MECGGERPWRPGGSASDPLSGRDQRQRAAWCRSIDVVEGKSRQMALFPEDREAPELTCEVVKIDVSEVSLHDPRQWGACWLALWDRLDRFWGERLPPAGHARHPEDPRLLPADRPGQRVASSPPLVRAQRAARSPWQRRSPTTRSIAASTSWRRTSRTSSRICAVGDIVRRALRRAALRPDLDLFRERSAIRRQAPFRLQPGQAARLRAGGDRADRHA